MFIPDEEKEGRKDALKKLLEMMGKGAGEKMSAMKKPVAVGIEISKDEPDEDDLDDGADMDDPMLGEDDKEPSEDEKSMIAKLYHKYC